MRDVLYGWPPRQSKSQRAMRNAYVRRVTGFPTLERSVDWIGGGNWRTSLSRQMSVKVAALTWYFRIWCVPVPYPKNNRSDYSQGKHSRRNACLSMHTIFPRLTVARSVFTETWWFRIPFWSKESRVRCLSPACFVFFRDVSFARLAARLGSFSD